MPSAYINGIVSPAGTVRHTASTVSCRLDLQQARLAHNGLHPAVVVGVGLFASRESGSGMIFMAIDTASVGVGPFGVEGAATFKGNYGFTAGTLPAFTDTPASGTVRLDGGGGSNQVYYGHSPMSGNTIVNDPIDGSNRSLVGQYLYVEVPTAPTGLVVTGSPTPGQVNLSWTPPSDNGGTDITGYRIEYSGTTSGVVDVGPTGYTGSVVTGLTPGGTYSFRVYASNLVTTRTGGYSVPTAYSSPFVLGTVPSAPQSPAITALVGGARVSWLAPSSDGGVPLTGYLVDISTASDFSTYTRATVATGRLFKTFAGLTPGTTYYARVYATNAIGTGASSGSVSVAAAARTALSGVQGASLDLADGTTVELRSDGAAVPVVKLVRIPFGTSGTATDIATLPTGTASGQLATLGAHPRNLALAATPAGDIIVIGADGASPTTLRALRYARTSSTTWAAPTTLAQSLGGTEPIVAIAAHHAPGAGTSPVESVAVVTRRVGSLGTGALGFATVDLTALAAGSGALLLSASTDPSFFSTAPASDAPDTGPVDLVPLVPGGTRFAALGNGWAVVDVANGIPSGVVKVPNGTATPGPWVRVVGVNATTFALLAVSSGAITWSLYSTTGSLLGSGSYSGANALGGAFLDQWDAFYDRVANVVTIYYLADDSSRKLESIDISPTTYAATAAVVLTSTLGVSGSSNTGVRTQHGPVDERRVVVATANLSAGVKSTASYVDTSGNAAPNAPSTVDLVGFDATAAQVFTWTFGDNNPADAQTAYEFVIERVSDSVAVVSTGKVTSTTSSRTVNGGTLTNGVAYRWRVRTWDALDTVGTWSAFDGFTTAATGTLTITTPAADNPAGYDLSVVPLAWTYTQGDGYLQTQRRVRVIRVSDSAVLHDSTMQATTGQSYNAPVPTDVPVRIELSIITNAPGTPTIGPINRLLTSSYGSPMTPTVTLVNGEDYITVVILNPTPTGSRPATVSNVIERRDGGSAGDYTTLVTVPPNSSWNDHAVASGKSYEYRVRAVSA